MKIKRFSPKSTELFQTGFCTVPEVFNTVNMGFPSNKLVRLISDYPQGQFLLNITNTIVLPLALGRL